MSKFFKNTSLKQVAASDITLVLNNSIQQQLPSAVRQTNGYYPVFGSSPNNVAGAPNLGASSPAPVIASGTRSSTAGQQTTTGQK